LPKKTLKSVKKSGNEAIIQVKGNQKKLLENCQNAIGKTKVADCHTGTEKSRNRVETRKVEVYNNGLKHFAPEIKKQWGKYIETIIKVERTRKELNTVDKKWIKSFE